MEAKAVLEALSHLLANSIPQNTNSESTSHATTISTPEAAAVPTKRKYTKGNGKQHGSASSENALFLKIARTRDRVSKAIQALDDADSLADEISPADRGKFQHRFQELTSSVEKLQERVAKKKSKAPPPIEIFDHSHDIVVPESPVDLMASTKQSRVRRASTQEEEGEKHPVGLMKQLREQPAAMQELPVVPPTTAAPSSFTEAEIHIKTQKQAPGYSNKLREMLRMKPFD